MKSDPRCKIIVSSLPALAADLFPSEGTELQSKCVQCFTEAKKQAEKQEVNLVWLAAVVGKFESVHSILPLAQFPFETYSKKIGQMLRKGQNHLSMQRITDTKTKNKSTTLKD